MGWNELEDDFFYLNFKLNTQMAPSINCFFKYSRLLCSMYVTVCSSSQHELKPLMCANGYEALPLFYSLSRLGYALLRYAVPVKANHQTHVVLNALRVYICYAMLACLPACFCHMFSVFLFVPFRSVFHRNCVCNIL